MITVVNKHHKAGTIQKINCLLKMQPNWQQSRPEHNALALGAVFLGLQIVIKFFILN